MRWGWALLLLISVAFAFDFSVFNLTDPSDVFFRVDGRTGFVSVGKPVARYELDVAGAINADRICLGQRCIGSWNDLIGKTIQESVASALSGAVSQALAEAFNRTSGFLHATPDGWIGVGTSDPLSNLHVSAGPLDILLGSTLWNGSLVVSRNISGMVGYKIDAGDADFLVAGRIDNGSVSWILGNSSQEFVVFGRDGMRVESDLLVSRNVYAGGGSFYAVLVGNATNIFNVDPALLVESFIGIQGRDAKIMIGNSWNMSFFEIQHDHWPDRLRINYISQNSTAVDLVNILPNGNVGIGEKMPTEKLVVNGSIHATGSVTQASDIRLKKNLREIEGALEAVSRTPAYRFEWNEEAGRLGYSGNGIGLIAQDLEREFPELVREVERCGENGCMTVKAVDYERAVAVLWQAVRELKAELEELKK